MNHIEQQLRAYLNALGKGSLNDILSLFHESATVVSPLYGEKNAREFYHVLLNDTIESILKPLNFFSNLDTKNGSIHFLYTWTMKNGQMVTFECVDIVEFDDKGLIKKLTIIYDTVKTRQYFG
ncbi:nuclear transport factor 2 family protein [Fulvivirgaceae bacterium BMA10]|uniref:Nuclear transport factor 2 family protein n=1 Tax=Splendidivirga corallicola TaxID=3051826 RepID=A0ABT8KVE6_9BACT|nr:nuclear transport factor 2 family protein [Fulvivirgaceae bacterium BMA10]